jgi:hypothetical protein
MVLRVQRRAGGNGARLRHIDVRPSPKARDDQSQTGRECQASGNSAKPPFSFWGGLGVAVRWFRIGREA